MDEREKIIEILKQTSDLWKEEEYHGYITSVDIGEIADALIAANIGDVTEWKERAERHRVIALPGGRIKQLYSDEEVEQIAKERDELKERAGSEIKSCYKEIAQKRDEIAKLRKQLKRTQNAVKKQKSRTEVAERALENIVKQYWCAERGCNECEEKQGCIEGICSRYIQQAEKELQEEEE